MVEIPLSTEIPLWDAMNQAKTFAAQLGYCGPSALVAYQATGGFDGQGNYHYHRLPQQRFILQVRR